MRTSPRACPVRIGPGQVKVAGFANPAAPTVQLQRAEPLSFLLALDSLYSTRTSVAFANKATSPFGARQTIMLDGEFETYLLQR